jgi:uncharacterized protein (TIGR00645 family)
MAPFYVGLVVGLACLVIVFINEAAHEFSNVLTMSPEDAILMVLSLIDLSLAGNLLMIVVFSGYENFVSKIDHSGHKDWPEWMGTIDFTGLKLKLLSSIVAISAIQLLKKFMSVGPNLNEREIMWLVIIHVVFVVSSVLLALSDWMAGGNHGKPASGNGGADHGGGHGGGPAGGHGSGPSGDGKPEAKSQQPVRKAAPATGLPVRPPFTPPVRRKLH